MDVAARRPPWRFRARARPRGLSAARHHAAPFMIPLSGTDAKRVFEHTFDFFLPIGPAAPFRQPPHEKSTATKRIRSVAVLPHHLVERLPHLSPLGKHCRANPSSGLARRPVKAFPSPIATGGTARGGRRGAGSRRGRRSGSA